MLKYCLYSRLTDTVCNKTRSDNNQVNFVPTDNMSLLYSLHINNCNINVLFYKLAGSYRRNEVWYWEAGTMKDRARDWEEI